MDTSGKNTVSAKNCNNVQDFIRKFRELIPPIGQPDRFADYGFVINCTNFFESMSENDPAMLFYTLSCYENDTYDIDKDTAFVAYYCFCLYVYRKKDVEMLQMLLNHYVKADGDVKGFTFREYPVIWDLVGRICSLRSDYKRLLVCSAAGALAMPNNVTPWVNYVGAVIAWLEALYSKNRFAETDALPEYIEKLLEQFGNEDFGQETVIKAVGGAVRAIKYNASYAKYYFNTAKLLFYYRYYLMGLDEQVLSQQQLSQAFVRAVDGCEDITVSFADLSNHNGFALRKQVATLLDTAIALAKSDVERAKYKQFADYVEAQFSKTQNVALATKNKILNSHRLQDIDGLVKCSTGQHYVIVSYSHLDYKSVWCDIVELQNRGVNVVFDDILSSTKIQSGEEWIDAFRQKFENADGVLCYLSNNYIRSSSVMKELALIKNSNKPVMAVDLTGKSIISQIVADTIRQGANISSDDLNLITSVFSDGKLVFAKPHVDDAIGHFDKLIKRLNAECEKVFTTTEVEHICVQNIALDGKPRHPNEDCFAVDVANGIFVVADGITRKEGYKGEESVAQAIAVFFCSRMRENLAVNLTEGMADIPSAMKAAFDLTNKQLANYLQTDADYLRMLADAKSMCPSDMYFERPGCVAVVAVINNGVLYFGRVGDCGCVLVRNGQKVGLTFPQTQFAFDVKGVENDRKLLCEKYVNKRNTNGGYGVVNGDENVSYFFDVVALELCGGDQVFVASDGVANFLQQVPAEMFKKEKLQRLLDVQAKLYKEMSIPLDDRTVIKISVADI